MLLNILFNQKNITLIRVHKIFNKRMHRKLSMNKNVSLFQLCSSVPVERHGNEANFRK